jgi:hypothetical protein
MLSSIKNTNIGVKNKMTILKEGDRIHLKFIRGQYTVVKAELEGVHVSCRVWIARAGYPEIIPTKFIKYEDIKCLVGKSKLFKYMSATMS